jgi:hypothetical protein
MSKIWHEGTIANRQSNLLLCNMALMMEKLYDALRAGNVPDDKARAAAVEAATDDARLAKVESRMDLLTWMVGFNLALTVTIAVKIFLR